LITISEQLEVKVWNYVTGSTVFSGTIALNKSIDELKHLKVIAVHVLEDKVFLALNSSEICVYSFNMSRLLFSFNCWQDEEVVLLEAISTIQNSYLFVVLRSSAIFYKIGEQSVERVSQFTLNCKKSMD
jgi:hypothetical protein